jgi:hypothetical protein
MNEITMAADALLDAVSKFHFKLKSGKSNLDEQLHEIGAIATKVRRLDRLIESKIFQRESGALS